MPNANNIIIYNTSTRYIISRLTGDSDLIQLKTGESLLVVDYTGPIDGRKVNSSLTGVEDLLSFPASGYWSSNTYYTIDGLPNNTSVVVSGDTNGSYTVNGSVSVYVPYGGIVSIELSANGYENKLYQVTNPNTAPSGGGGTFPGGGMIQ